MLLISFFQKTLPLLTIRSGRSVDRDALLAVLRRLIDLVEAVELHQSVERETALVVEFDQTRDEEIRHAVAFDDADSPLAGRHDPVRIETGLGPKAGAPTMPQVDPLGLTGKLLPHLTLPSISTFVSVTDPVDPRRDV